jgi:hypothetical protein
MARYAVISGGLVQREIFVRVTLCAMGAEFSSIAAPDSRHVLVMVGALKRVIACGMTAHAPRMRQQFSDLSKNRARAFCLVSDRFKFRWTFETLVATDFGSVSANAAESAATAEQPIDTIKKMSVPTSLPHL